VLARKPAILPCLPYFRCSYETPHRQSNLHCSPADPSLQWEAAITMLKGAIAWSGKPCEKDGV